MAAATERIRFFKMTGSGNDFILIDNRDGKITPERIPELARFACRHKLSVGADGLILIENDPEVDFRWRFHNSDGSEAEMCGNGARCAARFAWLNGIAKNPVMNFRTVAGIINAEILGDRVKIRVTTPFGLKRDLCAEGDGKNFCVNFITVGVPHVVHFLDDRAALDTADVFDWGRFLRYHALFQPAGSNINFAFVKDPHHIAIRTYERGVEDETLACGTGSTASALVAASKGLAASPVEIETRSGDTLTIHFTQLGPGAENPFDDVYLEGGARVVYEADLWDETLRR